MDLRHQAVLTGEQTIPARAIRLAEATLRGAVQDDLAGEAAQMAFYFFLALFPAVVVVFAITGIAGGDAAFSTIVATVKSALPEYARQFVEHLVQEITQRDRPGFLSLGVLLTAWAASSGVAAVIKGLNAIYDVKEPRPWWKRRLLAFAVLTTGMVALVAGTALMIPSTRWLSGLGLRPALTVARWPLGFLLVTGAVWLAYNYLPARNQRGCVGETLAGAVVATVLWIGTIALVRVYLSHFSNYGATYGALGAVIALLLWFYAGALVLLVGAELAAVLELERRDHRAA